MPCTESAPVGAQSSLYKAALDLDHELPVKHCINTHLFGKYYFLSNLTEMFRRYGPFKNVNSSRYESYVASLQRVNHEHTNRQVSGRDALHRFSIKHIAFFDARGGTRLDREAEEPYPAPIGPRLMVHAYRIYTKLPEAWGFRERHLDRTTT